MKLTPYTPPWDCMTHMPHTRSYVTVPGHCSVDGSLYFDTKVVRAQIDMNFSMEESTGWGLTCNDMWLAMIGGVSRKRKPRGGGKRSSWNTGSSVSSDAYSAISRIKLVWENTKEQLQLRGRKRNIFKFYFLSEELKLTPDSAPSNDKSESPLLEGWLIFQYCISTSVASLKRKDCWSVAYHLNTFINISS